MSSSDNIRKLFELYRSNVGEIDETLSPYDEMWEGDEPHYRRVGESAVKCIALALLAAGRDPARVKTILDLPCGHGRVLRYLLRVFPEAEFTACDSQRDAVDFCRKTFGVTGVYSNAELSGVEFPDRYDLIWCGSLFTHFDAPRWKDLLQLFCSVLAPEGILVFSTGGGVMPRLIAKGWDYQLPNDRLRQLLAAYHKTGFGYVDYEGQVGYGISIARSSWTMSLLQQFPSLRVLSYLEGAWDDHHDVVVCVQGLPQLAPGPALEKTRELGLEDG